MAGSEIAAVRALLSAQPRPPERSERRNVRVKAAVANGVAAEWTSMPEADDSRAIIYLHGGGYVLGSLDSYRQMVAEVSRAAIVAERRTAA